MQTVNTVLCHASIETLEVTVSFMRAARFSVLAALACAAAADYAFSCNVHLLHSGGSDAQSLETNQRHRLPEVDLSNCRLLTNSADSAAVLAESQLNVIEQLAAAFQLRYAVSANAVAAEVRNRLLHSLSFGTHLVAGPLLAAHPCGHLHIWRAHDRQLRVRGRYFDLLRV